MTLYQKINEDLKEAMRGKNVKVLGLLRLLKTGIEQPGVPHNNDIDDSTVLTAIRKAIKSRNESIVSFTKGNRPDLVKKEQEEVEILRSYLPLELTVEELTALVYAAISELGASSVKQMGKVITLVADKAGGRADKGTISQLVKQRLTNN